MGGTNAKDDPFGSPRRRPDAASKPPSVSRQFNQPNRAGPHPPARFAVLLRFGIWFAAAFGRTCFERGWSSRLDVFNAMQTAVNKRRGRNFRRRNP
jgi:hypothetical protein